MSAQIPTLNMAHGPDDHKPLPPQFVAALGQAFEEFGFCGIQGHGINHQLLTDAYAVIAEFFALPQADKDRYSGTAGGARGYTGFGVESAKDSAVPDLKEFWHVGREMPAGTAVHPSLLPNLWPHQVAHFRLHLSELYHQLDALSNRLLAALATYLELPSNYFDDKVNLGNSILRPLHYPPIPQRDTPSMRAAAHEDINLITLLVGSDEPGLEVLSKNEQWLPVTSDSSIIVVNIGDMMQRLTNHRLPSATHRVINAANAFTGVSRYSIPFFCHPNPDYAIKTLSSCITQDNPNRYPQSITADDYLQERLAEIGLTANSNS